MVRNRLPELVEKSNLSTVNKSGMMGNPPKNDESVTIDMHWIDDEITRFLTQVEELRTKAIALKVDIEQVKVLQKELLDVGTRDEKVVQKLDSLMESVKQDSRKLMTDLKAMEKANLETIEKFNHTSNNTVHRIRKFQYKSLLKSFNELLEVYQNVQSDYHDKCRARLENLMRIKTGKPYQIDSDGATESLLENGDWKDMATVSLFTDGYQLSTEKAKQDLYLANVRLNDLRKIESALKDVHELFMEMAGLVAVQGEQIDTIEKNVEDAVDSAEKANVELDSAKKLQKRARKNKIRIILILSVLAVVLLLIIYLYI